MKKKPSKRAASGVSVQRRVNPSYERPFEVSAPAIANLTPEQFVAFLTHLLRAEIALYGGAANDLLGNFAPGPDGGRDATTRRTLPIKDLRGTLIPEGETVWQFKAEQQPPSVEDLAEEISKEKPSACLDRGENYVFAAQKPSHDEDEVDAMLKSIAISNCYNEAQVRFFAQHGLAEFARRHPSLALLKFFPIQPEGLEPFEIWERDHVAIPFEPSAHVAELAALRNGIRPGRFHITVTGPTGVGKSRMVLETIRAMGLESFVAYAATPGPHVDQLIAHLRMDRLSCLVIVDECDEANAAVLRERLASTHAGLITIGADREGAATRAPSGDALIRLRPLPYDVIAKVLETNQGLDPAGRNWIAAHTGGYIKLARFVGDELARDPGSFGNLAQLSAATTVEHALVRMLGNDRQRVEILKLIACFSSIGHTSTGGTSELRELAAKLGINDYSLESLCSAAKREQILADTGSYYYVTPDLLAQWLLEAFLRVHSASFIEWLPNLPERLRQAHIRQLERLRGSPDGKKWASKLIEPSGPFGDLLAVRQPWADEALLALSAAAKDAAISYVASWANDAQDAPARIARTLTLQRVLFRLMRSESGFLKLFPLLVSAYELAGAPVSGELWGLLECMLIATGLSSTLAPYSTVLDGVESELRVRPVNVRRGLLFALGNGIVSSIGEGYSEFDREPNDTGRVATSIEEARRAVAILNTALQDNDQKVRSSAASFFVKHARKLVAFRLHDDFFAAIPRALDINGDIGAFAHELDAALAYEKLAPAVTDRIRLMRSQLASDTPARVRLVVEGWSIVDPGEEQGTVQRPDPESVADEVLGLADDALPEVVSLVFQPWAKNPGQLLETIAKRPDCVRVWPHVLQAGRATSNAWPCAMFLATMRDTGHVATPSALELLASSDEFDRQVAASTLTMSVSCEAEVEALACSLRNRLVAPNWTRASYMARWNEREPVTAVISLIEGLVAHGQGGAVAVDLSFRALESGQDIPSNLVVRALADSLTAVEGHDQWTWERVGHRIAEVAPAQLFVALLDSVQAHGPGKADDELQEVLAACCKRTPALASSLLELWDLHPYLVAYKLGAIITDYVDADHLVQWAGSDRQRQAALGHMVLAGGSPLTIELVERFGENSAFASAIEAKAGTGSWSGRISGFYASRGAEWLAYAERATSPRFRKLAERIGRALNASAEQAQEDEADEDALER